jgi:cyclopropane-fatty-acyl-phospholipid synthase
MENFARNLLEKVGIEINGIHPWDIQVHDPKFYDRVLQDPEFQFGETYMDGLWDCDALDEAVTRILRGNLLSDLKVGFHTMLLILRTRLLNLQSRSRSFQVGETHYDLGNDLYQAMLDKRMNYTCAYWKDASTLDEAQEAKLELICKKINLQPGMTVLELGCGWGSFAKYAAENYGVSVWEYTVSRSTGRIRNKALCRTSVTIKNSRFREVTALYDRVISMGFW